ncbi:hypothetical protein LBFF_1322 [Limosilactobacillus fermentum F-6]|nr:hypothetical protein LBFF_1322 [Limosilactobacillus fermentum F-6]
MGSTFLHLQELLSIRDHPHIHGEHLFLVFGDCAPSGSPPYTWGALELDGPFIGLVGITPIYMGSTPGTTVGVSGLWDHPHIHGEHSVLTGYYTSAQGSPPYTWGARKMKITINANQGITPIYMGSTWCHLQCYPQKRDHPHIHGEHRRPRHCQTRRTGSPPYTWGARWVDPDGNSAIRITPIYMGSTKSFNCID